MQPQWLEKILSGKKSLEIRSRRLATRRWFLGCKGFVYGHVVVHDAFLIEDDTEWRNLVHRHRVDTDRRRYTKNNCWAHPLEDATRIEPIPYVHHQGAIGVLRFERRATEASDGPVRPQAPEAVAVASSACLLYTSDAADE